MQIGFRLKKMKVLDNSQTKCVIHNVLLAAGFHARLTFQESTPSQINDAEFTTANSTVGKPTFGRPAVAKYTIVQGPLSEMTATDTIVTMSTLKSHYMY